SSDLSDPTLRHECQGTPEHQTLAPPPHSRCSTLQNFIPRITKILLGLIRNSTSARLIPATRHHSVRCCTIRGPPNTTSSPSNIPCSFQRHTAHLSRPRQRPDTRLPRLIKLATTKTEPKTSQTASPLYPNLNTLRPLRRDPINRPLPR